MCAGGIGGGVGGDWEVGQTDSESVFPVRKSGTLRQELAPLSTILKSPYALKIQPQGQKKFTIYSFRAAAIISLIDCCGALRIDMTSFIFALFGSQTVGPPILWGDAKSNFAIR